MKRLGIMASGRGSHAEKILRFCRNYPNDFKIEAIICNSPKAQVVERIGLLGENVSVVPGGDEEKILKLVGHCDWILLAGYMKILSLKFLKNFDTKSGCFRVINIHPSYLPEFPGLNAYERAFKSGGATSGATLHYVDSGVDSGPIIFQKRFPLFRNDTLESFESRGLEVEYELYEKFLQYLLKGEEIPAVENTLSWNSI